MPNTSGNAFALTTLCPLKELTEDGKCATIYTRTVLQNLPTGAFIDEVELSPLARVPNTYLARLFILDDTIFQSFPHHLDQLKSKYLVFTANFYGKLDDYLHGMYQHMKKEVFEIWKYCYGFDEVVSGEAVNKGEEFFIRYIKKCQMNTTFFFNGSTDDSLSEQLKSLYLKQELSKFVFEHQGVGPEELLNAFKLFIQKNKPESLEFPTWRAGESNFHNIIKDIAD